MVEVSIRMKYGNREIRSIISGYESTYGHLSDLLFTVRKKGCSSPQFVDDLMIWSSIINSFQEGVEYEKEIVTYSNEFFNIFTPRKLELLERVIKRNYSSVREIAKYLNRDYKNVYDDLRSLYKAGLIEMKKHGREISITAVPLSINIKVK